LEDREDAAAGDGNGEKSGTVTAHNEIDDTTVV
jgi:hypothetical protein